ncbi:enoyl-CoA hydratase [Acrocarpospora pleiomorpha]|uniref:Enoyl-CoA hydratase n=1 Tax=Acrocarpospora pleiomorpha TaxID=90975 RepID=A0A5M3XUR2_9ACTN|nr:enoyl-CoA hydratase-related protein [Acrocarpospora pleiomorpha]GES24626.1 enoyl-CoA hydratase [Acrocarpospora pleiomorpha]
MKEYEDLLIERVGTDGRVARISINRPEVLNALRPRTFGELEEALRDLEADDSARVIILRGAGRAFSVGYDIGGPGATSSPHNPERVYDMKDEQGRPLLMNFATRLRQVSDIQLYLFRMSKVTIAETHGHCIAGGMELAMMTDLVTTTTTCRFGHPGHRGIGVARNGMLLPLIIGMRKAKELFFTGDSISGEEAVRLGIANYAFEPGEVSEKTLAFADRIANQSADWLALLKEGVNVFYENMGIEAAVRANTILDSLARGTRSGYEWRTRIENDGLKEALAWRDGPYGDYRATPKKAD